MCGSWFDAEAQTPATLHASSPPDSVASYQRSPLTPAHTHTHTHTHTSPWQISEGRLRNILRSKGCYWLATDPALALQWSTAGSKFDTEVGATWCSGCFDCLSISWITESLPKASIFRAGA
jgi:G3E family GTPase